MIKGQGFGEKEERMVMEVETIMAKECCPSKSIHVFIMMSSCVC